MHEAITLRPSLESDLEMLFEHQADEEAIYMAAFTAENPNDKKAYMLKWKKLITADTIHMQSILIANQVVGCVVKYLMEGEAEITYAIGKANWGKGIATEAVGQFLKIEHTRPIYGRVAFDNYGSQRVLEKTGFTQIGESKGYANARGKEIVEYIYKLR